MRRRTHFFSPVVECRRWCCGADDCRLRSSGRCCRSCCFAGVGRSASDEAGAMWLETQVKSMAVVMRSARAAGPTMEMSMPGSEKKPRLGSALTSIIGGLRDIRTNRG